MLIYIVMIEADIIMDENKRDIKWTKKSMMTKWRWWVALTL